MGSNESELAIYLQVFAVVTDPNNLDHALGHIHCKGSKINMKQVSAKYQLHYGYASRTF